MSKTIDRFEGYSSEVREFFGELKTNNTKEFFNARRKFYVESIREVSKAFIHDMGIRFAEADLPYIADPKRSLFRINRDIRFSKNKDPYKTHLGVFFPYHISQIGVMPINALGLYYHFEESESFIAGGIHTPSSDALRAIRHRICADWELLERIQNEKALVVEFPDNVENDFLKRTPRGFPKNHPADATLRMKQFTVLSYIGHEESYSSSLIGLIERKARAIAPYLEFFQTAIYKG